MYTYIYIYAWYQEPGKTADMDGPEIMLMGREQEFTAKEDSTIDEQAGNWSMLHCQFL